MKNRAVNKLVLDYELSPTLRVRLPQAAFPCGPTFIPKANQMFLVMSGARVSWDLRSFAFMRPVNRCEGGQSMCASWGGLVSLLPLSPTLGFPALSVEHKAFVFSLKWTLSVWKGLLIIGDSWCISLRLRPLEVTSGSFLIHVVNHTPPLAPGWWQLW